MKERTLALLLGFMSLTPNHSVAQQVASRPVNTEQPVQVKDRAYYKQQYSKPEQILSLEEEAKRTNNANAWAQLCDLYCITNKLDDAIVAAENSLRIDPNQWTVYITLGTIQQRNKKYNEGIETVRKALTIQPFNPVTLCAMGVALYHKGDYIASLPFFDKSLELNPDYKQAVQARLATLQKLGR